MSLEMGENIQFEGKMVKETVQIMNEKSHL